MADIAAAKKGIGFLILYRVIPTFLLLILGIFVTIASLIGFFPETFGPVFSDIISLHEGGIYADCSLAVNKNNRLCSGLVHETATHRDWSSLQKSKKLLPFNLHNGK